VAIRRKWVMMTHAASGPKPELRKIAKEFERRAAESVKRFLRSFCLVFTEAMVRAIFGNPESMILSRGTE